MPHSIFSVIHSVVWNGTSTSPSRSGSTLNKRAVKVRAIAPTYPLNLTAGVTPTNSDIRGYNQFQNSQYKNVCTTQTKRQVKRRRERMAVMSRRRPCKLNKWSICYYITKTSTIQIKSANHAVYSVPLEESSSKEVHFTVHLAMID